MVCPSAACPSTNCTQTRSQRCTRVKFNQLNTIDPLAYCVLYSPDNTLVLTSFPALMPDNDLHKISRRFDSDCYLHFQRMQLGFFSMQSVISKTINLVCFSLASRVIRLVLLFGFQELNQNHTVLPNSLCAASQAHCFSESKAWQACCASREEFSDRSTDPDQVGVGQIS